MILRLAWKIRQVIFQVFYRYNLREKLEPYFSFQLGAHLTPSVFYDAGYSPVKMDRGVPKVLLVFPKILEEKNTCCYFF